MPLVQVYHREQQTLGVIPVLADTLPEIIARNLSCENPNGGLTSFDIEVKFFPIQSYDTKRYDFQIVVFANDYPERRENLNHRRREIVRDIEKIIPCTLKGFVWILLCPGSFGEIHCG